MAIPLLETTNIRNSHILADRAYGSEEIRSYIVQHNANYVIPPKQNTKDPWFVDWHLYKERHLVECFFNKLKQFRRVATRYDKLASSFLAFVYVAAIAILLNVVIPFSKPWWSRPRRESAAESAGGQKRGG